MLNLISQEDFEIWIFHVSYNLNRGSVWRLYYKVLGEIRMEGQVKPENVYFGGLYKVWYHLPVSNPEVIIFHHNI